MSWPITFCRRSGDYDFVSPLVNATGNPAVLGILCGVVAGVAYGVFRACGAPPWAIGVAVTIPATVAVGCGGVCLAGVIGLIWIGRNCLRR